MVYLHLSVKLDFRKKESRFKKFEADLLTEMLPVNGALVFNAQPVGRACKLRESRENKQCEPGAVCHAT